MKNLIIITLLLLPIYVVAQDSFTVVYNYEKGYNEDTESFDKDWHKLNVPIVFTFNYNNTSDILITIDKSKYLLSAIGEVTDIAFEGEETIQKLKVATATGFVGHILLFENNSIAVNIPGLHFLLSK